MKRFLLIAVAVLMVFTGMFGCKKADDKTAAPAEAPKAAETVEKTEAPTVKPTEEPTAEPTEEPTPEPTEEPAPEVSTYVSDEYDFYVEINNPAWKGDPSGAGGVTFTDQENDPYGTTQIVLYSMDGGSAISNISMDDMVTSVIGGWKSSYGEENVKVLTDITEIDVNGNNGRMQDAEVTAMGFTLKAKVVIWIAGTRLYLGQMIGIESGYYDAEPILQGMLDSFESAQSYYSRIGNV